MVHKCDRRCWEISGHEDGKWASFAGHHKLSVTTRTVLTGCHVVGNVHGHVPWFGLVWFALCLTEKAGVGNPIFTRGNVEKGSGTLPNQFFVADTDRPDCHSGVLAASRLFVLV